MNGEWFRTKGVVAAAVGAGILIGAAGILLFQQMMAEKKRLDKVASSVSLLRRELETLKSESRPLGGSSRSRHRSEARSLSDVDMFSTVSKLDEDDEESEFFDISDDEMIIQISGDAGENDIIMESEPLDELLLQVDTLFNGTSEDKFLAYQILHERRNKEKRPPVNLLWRISKACHFMSSIQADKKKDFIFEGLEYAKQALALDDTNADCHKWYAITLGSSGDFLPIKEKIGNGFVFKTHVDKAISLRPTDFSLYHLLGRFEFEVANLSWLERSVASSLFQAPPSGTFDSALQHFLKADELRGESNPWKENKLFIAKCHIQLNNLAEAVRWLDSATAVSNTSAEDVESDKEIHGLLTKYEGYRRV
ncbi:regulator of microtubule dynamics protein 1-like [Neocloeon triangulifer]|uniref:regulator of microtubule dynamics protein 1-like n=1 Tax=Neocloeon triangulifer TaxID=2078957 RepID=UPI00286F1457|nr:regulator of microtubule dynamics protein 1-like [Neocloeon triangulifer]XP_059486710.1 regulator of microtubule dynamics protein 1-like [Neocloeon triangulifer]